MVDYLAKLPEMDVAAWYGRLAQVISAKTVDGSPALAPMLLQHWLNNRDPTSTFKFAPPPHLIKSRYVTDVLQVHRDIFLSQRRTANGTLGGAITRLRSGAWDLKTPLKLDYHSLISVGDSSANSISASPSSQHWYSFWSCGLVSAGSRSKKRDLPPDTPRAESSAPSPPPSSAIRGS